jgi:hypothetical protein
LLGLIAKIDRRADARINQSVIDCASFLLIELDRIDAGGDA